MPTLEEMVQALAGGQPMQPAPAVPPPGLGQALAGPMQQLAMMDDPRGPRPKPVLADQFGGGGRATSPPGGGGPSAHPIELENFISEWAKGRMTAAQVQKEFKARGWTTDLRRGGSDVEAFDPTGKAHYLTP